MNVMSDRKQHIIDVAANLFLSEGVGVSTARIAKAAGVANGTLFNAFPTKQMLIDEVYRTAKMAMFGALVHSAGAPFNRSHIYDNWQGYLTWARANPRSHQVMHLLLESGLASAGTRAEVDALAAPHGEWVRAALEDGVITGPSAAHIGRLILAQADLALSENLEGADADLAFDMLCKSIGLDK